MKSSDILIRAISQEMPQPSATKICWKITCLKFYSDPPGANELTWSMFCFSQILKALFSKSGYAVPKSVAKQLSWQAIFVRLFILNSSDRTSESSTSSHHVNNENPSERSPAPRPKDFVDLSMKETAASNLTLTDSNHNLESVTGPNHISSTPNHNLDRSQHASSPFHLLVESPSLPSNQPQTPANASDALLPQLQGLSFNQLALGAETPLFAKKRLFDDLRSVSEFDAALQSSRSSSTSVEDLHSRTSKSESSEANPVIASQISQISVTPSELSFADSMSETASLPLDSVPLMINQVTEPCPHYQLTLYVLNFSEER